MGGHKVLVEAYTPTRASCCRLPVSQLDRQDPPTSTFDTDVIVIGIGSGRSVNGTGRVLATNNPRTQEFGYPRKHGFVQSPVDGPGPGPPRLDVVRKR